MSNMKKNEEEIISVKSVKSSKTGKETNAEKDQNGTVLISTVGGAILGNILLPGIGGALLGGLIGGAIGANSGKEAADDNE
ncbi:hypothetical protein [Neptunomonas sp. XY-337]|uniref:hypothetical protein n=1 Tax=Neptunomonas sp. XY-337 TaxID=2561897 RepID=UPI0010AB20D4|nr:hypothetical protein [Neptunomonas sp. XY-337]